jgi:hypothetical protein
VRGLRELGVLQRVDVQHALRLLECGHLAACRLIKTVLNLLDHLPAIVFVQQVYAELQDVENRKSDVSGLGRGIVLTYYFSDFVALFTYVLSDFNESLSAKHRVFIHQII